MRKREGVREEEKRERNGQGEGDIEMERNGEQNIIILFWNVWRRNKS